MTDPREIEDVIKQAEVLHLGLWDGRAPYVVPVNFAYQDGAIYLHSSPKGKKAEVLTAHPEVCFEVTVDAVVVREPKPCGFTSHYRSVIGHGRARAVTDPAEKIHALGLIMAHYGSDRTEFPPEIVAKTLVVRIDVDSMTGKRSPALTKSEAAPR